MHFSNFCSKIIFDQKLFSYCFDKFDQAMSIVYLSCSLKSLTQSFRFYTQKAIGRLFEYNVKSRKVLVGISHLLVVLNKNMTFPEVWFKISGVECQRQFSNL